MSVPMVTAFLGTQIVLVANFTDENGNPVDPATVYAEVLDPNENVIPLSPVKEVSGQYSAPFIPTANGLHCWRFVGGGPSPATVEDTFMAQGVFVPPFNTSPVLQGFQISSALGALNPVTS